MVDQVIMMLVAGLGLLALLALAVTVADAAGSGARRERAAARRQAWEAARLVRRA
jgi:hypothetical protein